MYLVECISLPSKYNAKMGNPEAVTRSFQHRFDERPEEAGYDYF
jgi:hypothetical protein